MRSVQPGKRTSAAEVLSISSNGIWLLVDAKEYFLAFTVFPWFKEAPVSHVLNVEQPRKGHLYWPDLDVDLGIESIEHPERFPLVSEDRRSYRPKRRTAQRPRGPNRTKGRRR